MEFSAVEGIRFAILTDVLNVLQITIVITMSIVLDTLVQLDTQLHTTLVQPQFLLSGVILSGVIFSRKTLSILHSLKKQRQDSKSFNKKIWLAVVRGRF